MSDEPKGTDNLQADIAKAYRNMKAEPCLSMGLRTGDGIYELCDKHYDASKTESSEHCAVCKLESQVKARERIAELEAKESECILSKGHDWDGDTCMACGRTTSDDYRERIAELEGFLRKFEFSNVDYRNDANLYYGPSVEDMAKILDKKSGDELEAINNDV